jgi:hypothetical protein
MSRPGANATETNRRYRGDRFADDGRGQDAQPANVTDGNRIGAKESCGLDTPDRLCDEKRSWDRRTIDLGTTHG